jgi:hypothetical protein
VLARQQQSALAALIDTENALVTVLFAEAFEDVLAGPLRLGGQGLEGRALNPSSIRFYEPVELSLPTAASHPIAKPLNGHIIEAVRCSASNDESDFVKAYYTTRWLVVERDPFTNLVRESTATYANAKAAFNAYWYATDAYPLDWEAWISPLFATSQAEAA